MQVVEINRRRHGTYLDPRDSRRQTTICYTVPNGKGQHLQVCRKVFSEIFAISHHKVQGLVKRKKNRPKCVQRYERKNKSPPKIH